VTYISELAERIRGEVPQEALPTEDTDPLFLKYVVLALPVGEDVRAEDVHGTWSAWMIYHDPLHQFIKPFTQLSSEMKKTDQPFVDAIREVAWQLP
jgi:hypothetical protein